MRVALSSSGTLRIQQYNVTFSSATPLTTLANRISCEIQNTGLTAVYVGPVGVTPTTGRRIDAGAAWALDISASVTLYAITATGSTTVIFTEVK